MFPKFIAGSQSGFRYFWKPGSAVSAIAITERNESWKPGSKIQAGRAASRIRAEMNSMLTGSARRNSIRPIR